MNKNIHAGMRYRFDARQQENGSSTHLLYFYDEISAKGEFDWTVWDFKESETSAKYIRDRLEEIPDGEEIEIHINSRGGEVGEGVTIYNILRQKAQKGSRIVCYVDGYCYSVAVDIAMAADEIRMGLGTSMLVHFPWAQYVSGNAKDLREVADNLDALGEAAVQLYMNRAKGITEEELRDMMEKEAMLTPEQCLKYGFCDVVDTYEAELPEGGEGGGQPEGAQQLVRQLREQMAAREEFMSMLQALKEGKEPKPPVQNKAKETFLKALRGI